MSRTFWIVAFTPLGAAALGIAVAVLVNLIAGCGMTWDFSAPTCPQVPAVEPLLGAGVTLLLLTPVALAWAAGAGAFALIIGLWRRYGA